MSRFLCHVFFLLLSVIHYATALQLTNVSFWHNSNDFTLKPTPGDVISVSMSAEVNDPRRVDLVLYNIDLQNGTTVLLSLNPIRDANVGFHIPWVPSGNFWLQIYLSPTTSLLVQSTTFQIYAPNATEVTIPPPSMIPSSGSAPVTSTAAALTGPNDQSASKTPAQSKNQRIIIVGVTLGAVILILLMTTAIFFFRYRRIFEANPLASSKIKDKSSTSPQLVNIESGAALEAAKRAEALREERERLDREIASMEGTVRSLTRNQ